MSSSKTRTQIRSGRKEKMKLMKMTGKKVRMKTTKEEEDNFWLRGWCSVRRLDRYLLRKDEGL
jgi:hypothetical protein